MIMRRQRETGKGQDAFKRGISPVTYFLQLGQLPRVSISFPIMPSDKKTTNKLVHCWMYAPRFTHSLCLDPSAGDKASHTQVFSLILHMQTITGKKEAIGKGPTGGSRLPLRSSSASLFKLFKFHFTYQSSAFCSMITILTLLIYNLIPIFSGH